MGEFELDDMSNHVQIFIHVMHMYPNAYPLQGMYHPKHNTLYVVLKNKVIHDTTIYHIVLWCNM